MKIEHTALNVSDPEAVAQWYVRHLGMTVKRSADQPVMVRFLADSTDSVMLEIYQNAKAEVLSFEQINPLSLHLAFVSDDIEVDRKRLLAAGATEAEAARTLGNGDEVAMLRDPWGLAIQLVCRAQPMM